MHWKTALAFLLISNVASVIMTKLAADRIPSKAIGVTYQYLCSIVFALVYSTILISLTKATFIVTEPVVLGIALIGALNALANYCQWQASSISLSKTALTFPLISVVSIALAVVFLSEGHLWDLQLTSGIILCMLAMFSFRVGSLHSPETKKINTRWLWYVLAKVTIFGTSVFLLKVFSFSTSIPTFLISWYGGALLGAIALLHVSGQNLFPIVTRSLLWSGSVAFTIVTALMLMFLTYQLGGQVSFISPINGTATSMFPALVGLLILKEQESLRAVEKIGFLVGIVGIILILWR